MNRIRGVVWDLDDTLSPERDYVRSGFRAVANEVAMRSGIDAHAASTLLWGDFEAGVRGDAFDRLRAAFPAAAAVPVADMVRVYREHSPDIRLRPEVAAILDAVAAAGARQGVISDGPLVSQSAKATALGLPRWCDPIVLTDAWGREFWKPHRRAFESVEQAWDLPGDSLVYVGDNPGKDFVAPAALGWATVRLVLPGQVRGNLPAGDAPAQVNVRSLDELRSWLLARI